MLGHWESTWQRICFTFTVWMGKAGRSCSASSDAGSCYGCGATSTLPGGDEACGGAHYWAREIAKRGHEVRLMSPRFVRPYVKSNKNDARDAEAICEAVNVNRLAPATCAAVGHVSGAIHGSSLSSTSPIPRLFLCQL